MAAIKDKRHERFCQEYIVDYNGTQAAIRVGYSAKSAKQQAARLLTNADLLARVRELQHAQVERLSVTQDFVVAQLMSTYNRCMQATPVLDMSGNETGEYQFDSKGALRALELLGKHLGMYNDKLQLTGNINTGQLDNVLAQLRGGSGG